MLVRPLDATQSKNLSAKNLVADLLMYFIVCERRGQPEQVSSSQLLGFFASMPLDLALPLMGGGGA